MIYTIKTMGIKQVQTKFTRMAEARIDATPVMEEIADTMMGIILKIFESQGRRGGGSWSQLSEQWVRFKANNALDPRIGFATGEMVTSLTERDAPYQVLHITPQSAELGSSLERAAIQNRERPFTKFTERDRAAIRAEVRAYLMLAFTAGKDPA